MLKQRWHLLTLTLLLALAAGCNPIVGKTPSNQLIFRSGDGATTALVSALKTEDKAELLAVLGPEAEDLVDSGDEVEDRKARERFLEAYDKKHSITGDADGPLVLELGDKAWPFPIPLVRDGKGWRFDSAAGMEELLDRRIGRNELSAIKVTLAYVDAQREYYRMNPEKSPLLHYAARLGSTPGERNGLYWEAAPGEAESPLGPKMAEVERQGYVDDPEHPVSMTGSSANPYHGYLYRILTAQGPAAHGGAYDYLVRGQLLGGFGLVAYPAAYDSTGVMTFVVNQDGQVYQKDLGPDTVALASAMTTYDPDASWAKVGND